MAQTINNPRFPHTCKIYNITGNSPFSSGGETVIYQGECRKYKNNSPQFNKVLTSDYGVSIPGTIEGIKIGFLIDITDKSGEYKECVIRDCSAGNLGTSVFINIVGN